MYHCCTNVNFRNGSVRVTVLTLPLKQSNSAQLDESLILVSFPYNCHVCYNLHSNKRLNINKICTILHDVNLLLHHKTFERKFSFRNAKILLNFQAILKNCTRIEHTCPINLTTSLNCLHY